MNCDGGPWKGGRGTTKTVEQCWCQLPIVICSIGHDCPIARGGSRSVLPSFPPLQSLSRARSDVSVSNGLHTTSPLLYTTRNLRPALTQCRDRLVSWRNLAHSGTEGTALECIPRERDPSPDGLENSRDTARSPTRAHRRAPDFPRAREHKAPMRPAKQGAPGFAGTRPAARWRLGDLSVPLLRQTRPSAPLARNGSHRR